MNLRDKLIQRKNKVHSLELNGETWFYKMNKATNNEAIVSASPTDVNCVIFALCACEADGTALFDVTEIETVRELDSYLVAAIANAATTGNELKQQGH